MISNSFKILKFKFQIKKVLSYILVVLIVLSSIKFLVFKPTDVRANDIYIRLDEGYGTTPSDSNSTISAGTITNALWKDESMCKVGKCLYFDGTGDLVSFADNSNLDFGASSSFTLEGWFRTPDITSGQRTIIAKHNATAGGYKVYMDSNGYVIFGIDDDSTWTPDDSASTSATAFDDNKWHFFSAVKTETSISLYVDGKNYQTDSSLAATGTLANANTFYIGMDGNGSSNGFSGFLDEIRIIKTAKSASEVLADYNGGTATTTGVGPVGWWKMDENTGSTANDSSGNDYNGTLTNSPTWATGKFGSALTFNGTTTQLKTTQTFATVTQGTISAWINTTSSGGAEQTIFAAGDDAGTNAFLHFLLNTSNQLTIYIRENTSANEFSIHANTALSANTWYFVTITQSPSGALLYLNGSQITDVSSGFSGTADGTEFFDDITSVDNTTIGYRDRNTNDAFFAGTIDDVRLYNYVRSKSQILEDMQGFPPAGIAASFGPDQSRLSDGLVGYWKMDESSWTNNCSTSTALDSSGNTNDGKSCPNTTGPTGGSVGKFGRAGLFDGSDDYVEVASSTSLGVTETFTFSAWVNATSLTSGNYYIFDKDGVGTDTTGAYNFYLQSGGRLCYETNNLGTGAVCTPSNTITTGSWYHVVASYDSSKSNKPYFYVDGVQTSYFDSSTTVSPSIVSTNLLIGRRGLSGSQFTGYIDEVRIYNRAFSQSDVLQLYSWSAGPVAYYKFDENTGTSVNDSSGNALTGSFTNSPSWASGKYGPGLYFHSANDDNISFGASTNLIRNYSTTTMEAWAKTDASGLTKVISDISVGTSTNSRLELGIGAGGRFYCGGRAGDAETFQQADASTPTLELNTWYHVACIIDYSNDSIKIYVNGSQVATTGTIAFTATSTSNTSPQVAYIGVDGDGFTNSFSGTIDDIKIYNYARTQKQVIEDMNGGHPAPGSPIGSMVAKWKMDEGYGTTAHDSSINANDLTLSTASWNTSGKFGTAFNGLTNVRMSRSDDDDLDFAASDDFSISFWFKSDSATNPTTNEYLLEKGGNVATPAIGYAIYTATSGGTICFGIDDDTTAFPEDSVCTSSDVYDATWHHLVAKKTGTTRLDLYVDGMSNGTPDTSISATGTLANSATFYIGDTNATDGTDEFLGDIDEVQIFRSSLTSDQIYTLYNNSSSASMGSLSTDSSNVASNSDANSYCPPGQGSACTPPVGEWRFDENTGQSINDISGNGNAGTLGTSSSTESVDPEWSPGKYGGGLKFDGIEDIATVSDNDALSFASNTMSASAWVKRSGNPAVNEYIILKGITTWEYNMRIGTGGTIGVTLWQSNGNTTASSGTSTYTITDGNWHYVAFTSDGSSLKVYVDGKLDSTSSSFTGAMTNTAAKLYFGDRSDSANTFLEGSLDQVRLFNYALTPAQIAWDYNHGGPVGWWKLDETSGTTANDSSGNSNTGTITAGTGSYTTGKFNNGYTFDGASTVINSGSGSSLDDLPANGMTVSAWIKPTSQGEGSAGFIMAKNVGTTPSSGWILQMAGTNALTFTVDGTTDLVRTTSNSVLTTSSWNHVLVTWDGVITTASSVHIYVNGTEVSYATTTNGASRVSDASSTFYIGNDSTSARTFDGVIDDARAYSYVLTSAQIKTNMNNGAAAKY